ncbi:hypothetical protein DFH11DRAFT_785712 [Phellopilus nigrolimitatus]|nr:hypothetical protein DFH11DRAFT_785712 [Phellopilus nigrolimitatus]
MSGSLSGVPRPAWWSAHGRGRGRGRAGCRGVERAAWGYAAWNGLGRGACRARGDVIAFRGVPLRAGAGDGWLRGVWEGALTTGRWRRVRFRLGSGVGWGWGWERGGGGWRSWAFGLLGGCDWTRGEVPADALVCPTSAHGGSPRLRCALLPLPRAVTRGPSKPSVVSPICLPRSRRSMAHMCSCTPRPPGRRERNSTGLRDEATPDAGFSSPRHTPSGQSGAPRALFCVHGIVIGSDWTNVMCVSTVYLVCVTVRLALWSRPSVLLLFFSLLCRPISFILHSPFYPHTQGLFLPT